jgi:hypothetical protein
MLSEPSRNEEKQPILEQKSTAFASNGFTGTTGILPS